ncbi:MAG: chromosome partitioning protein ParB, partial [Ancrocorticia sp.]|nr:chromosome partitioning protein ParB [Ancrocorticia sp.]
MAQRRRGLGRGIGALIPESQEEVRESPISVFFGGAVSRETDKKKTATPATSSGKTEEQALENENELVPVPGATYAELPVSAIIPNRKQPRSVFDDDELNE